jgi:hypothetical protein
MTLRLHHRSAKTPPKERSADFTALASLTRASMVKTNLPMFTGIMSSKEGREL